MRVIATGARGYIGSALMPALREAGHETPYNPRLSIHDMTLMGQYFVCHTQEVDAVIHLACETMGDWFVNVHGTSNVLGAVPPGKRFIFASALTAGSPHDQYDAEKQLGEKIVLARPDITAVILRLGNVYGPGPQSQRCTLNKLMRQAVRGETLQLFGACHGVRDYIYIDDVVSAFLAALTAPAGTYMVGTATCTTLVRAAEKIAEKTGVDVEVAPDAYAQHHATALESKWVPGWHPTVSLSEGLDQTISALRAEVQEAVAA